MAGGCESWLRCHVQPVDLLAHYALGDLGEDFGLRSPAIEASIIAREGFEQTEEASEVRSRGETPAERWQVRR